MFFLCQKYGNVIKSMDFPQVCQKYGNVTKSMDFQKIKNLPRTENFLTSDITAFQVCQV